MFAVLSCAPAREIETEKGEESRKTQKKSQQRRELRGVGGMRSSRWVWSMNIHLIINWLNDATVITMLSPSYLFFFSSSSSSHPPLSPSLYPPPPFSPPLPLSLSLFEPLCLTLCLFAPLCLSPSHKSLNLGNANCGRWRPCLWLLSLPSSPPPNLPTWTDPFPMLSSSFFSI